MSRGVMANYNTLQRVSRRLARAIGTVEYDEFDKSEEAGVLIGIPGYQ